jgi:LacI family transcriptional regulator
MVTIKDVAKKANVSTSTVSIVLNNRGYASPETRSKVQEAIEELEYKPLLSARKLATRRTGNIGYIVWEDHFSEVEMFYSQIFLGMEFAARDSDYYILLTTVKENFDQRNDLPSFLQYNDVDGVALAGRIPHQLIDYLDRKRIPFVLIDYGVRGKAFNSILIDNYNGAYEAVEYLVKSGRKQIGFVGGSFFHPSVKERFRGYKEVLEDYNILGSDYIEKYCHIENIETSRMIGMRGAEKLLTYKPYPDAIFCCNDTTALGVIAEVQKKGLKIPDDIAVIGFDDIPPASYNIPKLSTVKVPTLLMGKEAFKLLTEIIDNPRLPALNRIISTEFVKRDTC